MHILCMYLMYSSGVVEMKQFLKWGYFPVGLSYISGALKQAGFTTEGTIVRNDKKDIEKLLDGLKTAPDVFAVSTTSLYAVKTMNTLIDAVKVKFPKAKILVGGLYSTLCPENIIMNSKVDAVCIGEGEKAAVEYVRQVEKGKFEKTDNLWIKDTDGSVLKCDRSLFVEDINSIPMDRKIWDEWCYNSESTIYVLNIQRGCIYNCFYCSNHAVSDKSEGKRLKYRNIDNAISELESVAKTHSNIRRIQLYADNIFSDMDYFFELFRKLKKLNKSLNNRFKFCITGNCTPGFLKKYPNMARYLGAANVIALMFGFESGSLEIRKKLNRPHYENDDVVKFAGLLRKENIETQMGLMYCYPFETDKTCDETVEHTRKIAPDLIKYTFLRSYPHTRLNAYIEENNIPQLTFKDVCRYLKTAIRLRIKISEFFDLVHGLIDVIKLNKKSLRNRSDIKLAKSYFNSGDFKKAAEIFERLIETDNSAWIYGDLAIAKMNIGDYEGALKHFDTVLKSNIESKEMYSAKREECIKILGNKKN